VVGRRTESEKVLRSLCSILIALFLSAGLPSIGSAAAPPTAVGDVVTAKGSSTVSFRLITQEGSVRFAVPGDWAVLSVQSLPPGPTFAFQVPNPADQGTPDSTNISVTIFRLSDKTADGARQVIGKAYGSAPPKISNYKTWTIYTQEASQGQTAYTIVDGVHDDNHLDTAVAIRLAWPHLRRNAASYDADMQAQLRQLLDSVAIQGGAYTPASNEIVRQPDR